MPATRCSPWTTCIAPIFGVVGTFRERLVTAERALKAAGLSMDVGRRPVFPWVWPILKDLRHSLSAYLAHLEKASSRRLVEGLKIQFPWLEEYFRWHGSKVAFVCPTPTGALRYSEQVDHFARRLPGHVLVLRLGGFVEVVLPRNHGQPSYRLPRRKVEVLRRRLWAAETPVGWIDETGRRIARINERVLVCRWAAAVVEAAPDAASAVPG